VHDKGLWTRGLLMITCRCGSAEKGWAFDFEKKRTCKVMDVYGDQAYC